jgi:hypothetical protein
MASCTGPGRRLRCVIDHSHASHTGGPRVTRGATSMTLMFEPQPFIDRWVVADATPSSGWDAAAKIKLRQGLMGPLAVVRQNLWTWPAN